MLDFLPDTLDPTVKVFVTVMIGVHAVALGYWAFSFARDIGKGGDDNKVKRL